MAYRKEALMNRQQAFGLVELLMVLVLLGIIFGVAVPSFGNLLERTRQNAEVDQLVDAINLARGTAITRNKVLSLCAGNDLCDGSARWRQQILIFLDDNRNGQRDAGEVLLRQLQLPAGLNWNWSNSRSQKHLAFLPSGLTHRLNGTFTLCQGERAIRDVVISVTGRVRFRTPANSDDCAQ